MDVEVHLGTKVNNVTEKGVQLENQFLPARTVIWTAGNAASSLAKELDAETDRQGSVLVAEDLSIPSHPEIFAIGDIANFSHQTGNPLLGVVRLSPCRWGRMPLEIS
jgi:NADH:quinone reductase (non-electrogenic)